MRFDMSKRKNEFNESALRNNETYMHYYNHLLELTISTFEWKNLPDTIDQRYIELNLCKLGRMCFFKDSEIGYLCLPVNPNDRKGFNDEPIMRHVYANNGYHNTLNIMDSVMVYNNYLRINSMLDIRKYAYQLYELDRTIDVNARAQKTPVVVLCNEKERLSFLNLYKEVDGNSPIIFGSDDLDLSQIKAINTTAPFVADKLYTLKTELWNEFLTKIGVSNVNIAKKERLISDEVMRQSGGTIASRYTRLDMRKKACDQINKMFNLNIEVDYKQDYRVTDSNEMIDENGNVTKTIENAGEENG